MQNSLAATDTACTTNHDGAEALHPHGLPGRGLTGDVNDLLARLHPPYRCRLLGIAPPTPGGLV